MNSTIITRAQTPTSIYKYRTQASTLPVLSSSAVCWNCRLLLWRESEDPNMAIHPHPNPSTPQWIITVCSYSLKGQEKRFVSPPLYTVSHSKSQWCLGGNDRASCSFPSQTRWPLSLPPSSCTPSTFPSIGHFPHSVTQSIIKPPHPI